MDEAAEHAPNLVQLLMECTRKGGKSSKVCQKSVVGVCLSLLCKHRNPRMTLFQRMLSLVLYAGHSAKQVRTTCIMVLQNNVKTRCNPQRSIYIHLQIYTRLHKLRLCASHGDTLRSLDILGEGFDAKVIQWRDELTPRILEGKTVRTIKTLGLLCIISRSSCIPKFRSQKHV